MRPSELPLTIDLVPASCWFSNLRSELSKSDWDRLRFEQYQRAGHKCECCGRGGRTGKWPNPARLECHEKWAYSGAMNSNPVQELTGLIALCRSCHQVKHIGFAASIGNLEKATQHFRNVNGLSEEVAKRIIGDEFARWEKNSLVEYRLDISWLRGRGIDTEEVTEKANKRRKEVSRANKSKANDLVRVQMSQHLGPTPSGMIRCALVHSCGHITGLQIDNPAHMIPVEAQRLRRFLESFEKQPCQECLGVGEDESNTFDSFAQAAQGQTEIKVERRVKLACHQGTSDKVYEVDLLSGPEGHSVAFRYGRRGSNLKEGEKCGWVSRELAEITVENLVREKLRKGYVLIDDGAPSEAQQAMKQIPTDTLAQIQNVLSGKQDLSPERRAAIEAALAPITKGTQAPPEKPPEPPEEPVEVQSGTQVEKRSKTVIDTEGREYEF